MTDAERDERNRQMARTMALLVHASACGDPNCGSSNCLKVKQLFHHAVSCSAQGHRRLPALQVALASHCCIALPHIMLTAQSCMNSTKSIAESYNHSDNADATGMLQEG